MKEYFCCLKTEALGEVYISERNAEIISIGFTPPLCKQAETPCIRFAEEQLEQYLAGERKSFTFPVRLIGVGNYLKVWQALKAIPYGEVITYKQLAQQAGLDKAWRFAGSACACNPIAIYVPCHRVVKSDGRHGSYNGGAHIKDKLIALEKQYR